MSICNDIFINEKQISTPALKTFKSKALIEAISCIGSKDSLYVFFAQTNKPTRSVAIRYIERTNPITIHYVGPYIQPGSEVSISGVIGMSEIKQYENQTFRVVSVDGNSFQIQIDATGFSSYSSGGEVSVEEKAYDCSDASAAKILKSALGMKKVNRRNIELVIKRHDWSSNRIFSEYDYNFCGEYEYPNFTVTEEGNVFICVYSPGTASSYKPNIISTEPEEYPDGYSWQYVYTVDLEGDFVTKEYIPIGDLCNDNNTPQWDNQEAICYKGRILNFEIISAGKGYSDGEYDLIIEGDGKYAAGIATVENGMIVSTRVTNPGENYTYANAFIRNPDVVFAQDGKNSELKANIDKPSGLGRYATYTLQPSAVMIQMEFKNDEGGKFMIDNDFCVFGLLFSPREKETNNVAMNDVYDLRDHYEVENAPATFIVDEKIEANSNVALVTQIGGDSNELLYTTREKGTSLEVGDQIIGQNSASTNIIKSVELSPIIFGSGALLYFEFLDKPIIRDPRQSEVVSFSIQF